eukprot:1151676-Pelagomonas_calceolata.AAC.10
MRTQCMLSQDGNSQDADAAEVVWARSSPGMARSMAQVGLAHLLRRLEQAAPPANTGAAAAAAAAATVWLTGEIASTAALFLSLLSSAPSWSPSHDLKELHLQARHELGCAAQLHLLRAANS